MRLDPRTRRPHLATCLALLFTVLALVLTAAPAGAATATAARSVLVSAKAAPATVSGCSAYAGARSLGTAYSDSRVKILTCGSRPSFDGARKGSGPVVLPFAGSRVYYRGYQCIELIARYLQARFKAAAGTANGAQAVDRYAAAYPAKFRKIANGTRKSAPRVGDVLSLSTNKRFNDVGHTGIVTRARIGKHGNGTIRAAEQNYGGTTGARGYHDYTVKKWRVVFKAMPHVKWLRAR